MTTPNKCPNCNTPMVDRRDGLDHITVCPRCGYEVMPQYEEDVRDEDETRMYSEHGWWPSWSVQL